MKQLFALAKGWISNFVQSLCHRERSRRHFELVASRWEAQVAAFIAAIIVAEALLSVVVHTAKAESEDRELVSRSSAEAVEAAIG